MGKFQNSDFIDYLKQSEQLYLHETETLRSQSIVEYMENQERLKILQDDTEEMLPEYLSRMQQEADYLSRMRGAMRDLSDLLQEKLKELKLEDTIDWDKLEEIELPEKVQVAIDNMIKQKAEQAEQMARINKSILESEKIIQEMHEATVYRVEIIQDSHRIQIYIKRKTEIYEEKRREIEDEKERNSEELEEAMRLEEEQKQKEEEDRKRKEEEDRKRLEEEAKLEKEEEKKRRETKKRDAEADRKKREQEKKEKMMNEIEMSELERKMRDSKYWPKYVYKHDLVDSDHKIACVIQCPDGVLQGKEDLTCDVVSQLMELPPINMSEDFVSSLIKVSQTNPEETLNFNTPWKICIPHCAPRNLARESIIMSYTEGDSTWKDFPTVEVSLDDPLDVSKFAEATINEGPLDMIFVVVSKMKIDRFQMGKKGGRVMSSVDNRVNLIFPQDSLKVHQLEISLQVQPMEASFLSDMKEKYPNETKNVITTSHIITFTAGKKRLFKPVSIIFTVPLDPTKKNRPTTAAASKSTPAQTSVRPKTAAGGFMAGDGDEDLRIMCRLGDEERWKEWREIKLLPQKNKDGVCFDIENLDTFKFFVIRSKPGASDESLVKLSETIDQAFTFRTLNLVLRQHVDDMNRITIVATPSNRISRALQQLGDSGFEEGPEPSPDIILCEREIIHIRFRGNISPLDDDAATFKMPYNSQMKNRIELPVKVIDKYAQKASDFYHGFAQFFVRIQVRKPVQGSDNTGLRTKSNAQTVLVEEDKLITELLITSPKQEQRAPRPLIKAPFKFQSEVDSVTMDYLKQMSLELGDEWKVLAQSLGLSRARVHAIQENNVGREVEDVIYDMFLTWVKGMPIMTNKAPILVKALVECERVDLAEELRDRELDHLKKLKESEKDKQSRKSVRIREDDQDSVFDMN